MVLRERRGGESLCWASLRLGGWGGSADAGGSDGAWKRRFSSHCLLRMSLEAAHRGGRERCMGGGRCRRCLYRCLRAPTKEASTRPLCVAARECSMFASAIDACPGQIRVGPATHAASSHGRGTARVHMAAERQVTGESVLQCRLHRPWHANVAATALGRWSWPACAESGSCFRQARHHGQR